MEGERDVALEATAGADVVDGEKVPLVVEAWCVSQSGAAA
jgi:hypothetical protein